MCFSTCSKHMCSEDGAFIKLHDVLCTCVFVEFASIFPPSLIYRRVLTMDECEILAPILWIIMAGAYILFCI